MWLLGEFFSRLIEILC